MMYDMTFVRDVLDVHGLIFAPSIDKRSANSSVLMSYNSPSSLSLI
jgi:hypothetical protein